jgi:hypothetical protein
MVALIPLSEELARRYLDRCDVYIHDAGLRYQIRLRATHAGLPGLPGSGRIEVIRPITRRWRVGSGAAISALPVASTIPLGLPLGWRPGSNGAAPALRRILHYPLVDLLAAARSGRTLADVARV